MMVQIVLNRPIDHDQTSSWKGISNGYFWQFDDMELDEKNVPQLDKPERRERR
jgi:hypothetical protein